MNPVVQLRQSASLRGLYVKARGSQNPIQAFLGIPYAEPPVGKLRFAPPSPARLWNGEKDATKFGPICPQNLKFTQAAYFPFHVSNTMSEDCLYLNVWTPRSGDSVRRPVMVWFYGGAFVGGFSDYFDGTAYATLQDVVFVSVNYRVGAFGFMCSDDEHVRGNMGLLDQVEALRWVQANIDRFGGDPSNVTVFGESAGAICISMHIVSPLSRGLFHRAIMQSGTACFYNSLWRRIDCRKYMMARIEKMGGKNIRTGKDMLEFLETKSAEEIVKACGEGFNPVLDGTFLTDQPWTLHRTGQFNPVEAIIGFNTDEGLNFILTLAKPGANMTVERAREIVEYIVFKRYFRGNPHAKLITEAAIKEYLDGVTDSDDLYRRVVEINGELLMIAPSIDFAMTHSRAANTFLYQFDHRASFSHYPDWVVANHGQEIPYVVGEPFLDRLPDAWQDNERRLSQTLMAYWSNFARTGDPNGTGLATWPQFDTASKRYAVLRPDYRVSTDYSPRRMNFWNSVVREMTGIQPKL